MQPHLPQDKVKLQVEIDRQTIEFKARGGKVKKLPYQVKSDESVSDKGLRKKVRKLMQQNKLTSTLQGGRIVAVINSFKSPRLGQKVMGVIADELNVSRLKVTKSYHHFLSSTRKEAS